MWEAVDLRELRVFLTLAEELHFGRTAQRLTLTPSRVSQSLRSLEMKLGGQLVHRTSRRVELTALGTQFNNEAAVAYEHLIEVLKQTHDSNRSFEGTLQVGLLTGPSAGPRFGAIIDAFADSHPDCRVEVSQVSWDDPFEQLRRGEIDAMTSWLPLAQPDLVVGPTLSRQSRVVAVAHHHPLASRDRISVEDLADYRVARFAELPSELHEAWIPSRTPSGRVIPCIPLSPPDRDMVGFAMRVARGELVHPTAASIAPYLGDFNIVFVPITDLPPLRSGLVWRRGTTDPRLRAFIGVAREVLTTTTKNRRAARHSKRDGM